MKEVRKTGKAWWEKPSCPKDGSELVFDQSSHVPRAMKCKAHGHKCVVGDDLVTVNVSQWHENRHSDMSTISIASNMPAETVFNFIREYIDIRDSDKSYPCNIEDFIAWADAQDVKTEWTERTSSKCSDTVNYVEREDVDYNVALMCKKCGANIVSTTLHNAFHEKVNL